MSFIDLSICNVSKVGSTMLKIEIPYWIPTFYITAKNEQKYYEITVPKDVVEGNLLPLEVVIAEMDAISERNPFKFLRAKNPHIVDYRRKNIGTFAPKKTKIKISAEDMEQKRDALNQLKTLYVPDHTIYYVEI